MATKRQKAFLTRLEQNQGKRLVVDLDAQAKIDLEHLLCIGYGGSQKEVVARALREAASVSTQKP